MTQLLDIKCIPIKLEFQAQPMKMEISRTQEANLEIEREKGGLKIEKNTPNMDTIEISKGPHTIPIRTAKNSSNGVASNSFADNSSSSTKVIKRGSGITEPLRTRSGEGRNLNDLVMEYKMDKIKFSCHKGESEVKFIPGDIQYTVSQYPDVEIDYIGDMLYVPPSANPNYEEPTTEE